MRVAPLLLALAGCSSTPPRTVLTVLAASSLTDVFTTMEGHFEAEHPTVDVQLSFAGSQTLATQIAHGIDADVFASANVAPIRRLAEDGRVEASRPFARNALVLVASDRVSDRVSAPSLEHLPDVASLVVGADEVPIGAYTAAMLEAAEARYGADWRQGVEARIVSREPNVRMVVAKVAMGEADAAIVYATDARSRSGLVAVPLPDEVAPVATLSHARLTSAPHPELADAWMTWVTSEEGQEILVAHGFLRGVP